MNIELRNTKNEKIDEIGIRDNNVLTSILNTKYIRHKDNKYKILTSETVIGEVREYVILWVSVKKR